MDGVMAYFRMLRFRTADLALQEPESTALLLTTRGHSWKALPHKSARTGLDTEEAAGGKASLRQGAGVTLGL